MIEKQQIKLGELTTCDVQADGEALRLNFIEASGNPVSLHVPFESAQAIAMTLPRLLTKAVQRITGEEESRYVFPLAGWRIEEAGQMDCAIVTFSTGDGFEVSFGIPFEACRSLGWALKNETESTEPSQR